jgi:hypothetical protein
MSKNTTLSEQFRNHVEKHVEKYNTVRAVPKSYRKIPHCQNSSEIMLKKHVEKYNTVRAVPKSCRKIPHCQNSSEMI